jgi:hypothetical protein
VHTRPGALAVVLAPFLLAVCGTTVTAPVARTSTPSLQTSALPCGVAELNELTNAVWSARPVGSCTIATEDGVTKLVEASTVVVSVAADDRTIVFSDPRIAHLDLRVGMMGGEIARIAPSLDEIHCERGSRRWYGDYFECRLRGAKSLECDNADGDVLIVLFDPHERDAPTDGDAARDSIRDREIRGLVETFCD